MRGKSWKGLEKLCPCVRWRIRKLIDGAWDCGIEVTVVETMRDSARQSYYVELGVSTTMSSFHLPQENGFCRAADIAPTDYLAMRNWNPSGPAWGKLGDLSKSLGLEWGGDWRSFPDKPHHQRRECTCGEENLNAEQSAEQAGSEGGAEAPREQDPGGS